MEKLKNHMRGEKSKPLQCCWPENCTGESMELPWSYQLLCSYQITGLTLMHLSTFVETS